MPIGKPTLIIQVPDRRVFPPDQAARYIGVSRETLRRLIVAGTLRPRWQGNRKVFLLEHLDAYIESLPEYNPADEQEAPYRSNLRNQRGGTSGRH